MNFYKIINNERALLTFIETLPNLEVNEVYLITLLWRGKYSKNNEKKGECLLSKKIVTKKNDLINSIAKLEVKDGLYRLVGDYKVMASDYELVLYIKPYPVNETHALKRLKNIITESESELQHSNELFKTKLNNITSRFELGEISSDEFAEGVLSIKRPERKHKSVSTSWYSSLMSTSGRKVFIDIDVDVIGDANKPTPKAFYDLIEPILKKEHIYGIVETNGGYHVQVRTSNMSTDVGGKWLGRLVNDLKNNNLKVEYDSNRLLPVPGCLQGNFTVKQHYFNDLETEYYSMEFLGEIFDEIILGCPVSSFTSKYQELFSKEEYSVISNTATKTLLKQK